MFEMRRSLGRVWVPGRPLPVRIGDANWDWPPGLLSDAELKGTQRVRLIALLEFEVHYVTEPIPSADSG